MDLKEPFLGVTGTFTVMPIDHGLVFGRIPGLENVWDVAALARNAQFDALLVNPGIAEGLSREWGDAEPKLIVAVDGVFGVDGNDDGVAVTRVASVLRAVEAGAAAVKVMCPWHQSNRLKARVIGVVAEVIEEARKSDIPVVVEPTAGLNTSRCEIDAARDAARIARELGADVVKIAYPGEVGRMRELCEELRVPVAVMGGPTRGRDGVFGLVNEVSEALQGGASGIIVGRRVWQSGSRRLELMRELVRYIKGEADASSLKGLAKDIDCVGGGG